MSNGRPKTTPDERAMLMQHIRMIMSDGNPRTTKELEHLLERRGVSGFSRNVLASMCKSIPTMRIVGMTGHRAIFQMMTTSTRKEAIECK